jgi:hypothetical protein
MNSAGGEHNILRAPETQPPAILPIKRLMDPIGQVPIEAHSRAVRRVVTGLGDRVIDQARNLQNVDRAGIDAGLDLAHQRDPIGLDPSARAGLSSHRNLAVTA